jgi:hypothetical protein
MIGNDVMRLGRREAAILRLNLRGHTPWGGKLRIEKDASREAHRPQHAQQRIRHGLSLIGGGSVKSSGASLINPAAAST